MAKSGPITAEDLLMAVPDELFNSTRPEFKDFKEMEDAHPGEDFLKKTPIFPAVDVIRKALNLTSETVYSLVYETICEGAKNPVPGKTHLDIILDLFKSKKAELADRIAKGLTETTSSAPQAPVTTE